MSLSLLKKGIIVGWIAALSMARSGQGACAAPVVYSGGTAPVVRSAATSAPQRRVARRRYGRRRYYARRRYYRSRHRTVVRRRPFSHSVAIVGGSAAGGAAIGALAGGGKGAAVGALAGGAGGLVYDRLTHKKVVRK